MAQDPLAQLEELLAKAKGQQSSDSGAAPVEPPQPSGPTPEELAAQQKAAEEARIRELERQSEAERAVALEELRSRMLEIPSTPQDQARREQEALKQSEKSAQDSQHEGFEIVQVTQTKV